LACGQDRAPPARTGIIAGDLKATMPVRERLSTCSAQALGDPPEPAEATVDLGAAHGVARLHCAHKLDR
jgi:hypothetical protein